MTHVSVLHESFYSANGAAFLFPLYYHRRRLRVYGVDLTFTHEVPATEVEILCISSRFFRAWWGHDGGEEIIALLKRLRQRTQTIIWFDISDSTGTTHFKILPYVDRYCKGQVLKDRKAYLRHYYGSRIFTDFYYRRFGIQDADPGPSHLNYIPHEENLRKIAIGWNSGLAHYGYHGMQLSKVWHAVPWFPRWYPRRWDAPSTDRRIPLSCRIGADHQRHTVAFSRREIMQRLQARQIVTEKCSRASYFKELRQSVAAASPFGLGEMTLRDFEIALCGAAAIKQDMGHMETWPNLWQEGMYLPFRWDLSNFEEKVTYAIEYPRAMVELAQRAQEYYRHVLMTEEGQQEFCDRFVNLLRCK